MKIIRDYPPNYNEIKAAFPGIVGLNGVLFSWGVSIYNPSNVTIPQHLIAHESVHGARQIGDIEGWWHHYIDDRDFRLAEEVLAHRRELVVLSLNGSRQIRRRNLVHVSKRLCSTMYGNLVTRQAATKLLRVA